MIMNAWQLLAGLGLFLLGMDFIEQGLKALGNDTLVNVLRRSTVTAWRGVLVGAVATALMQSSGLVGLLVLAFVGAGMMPMRNALGVVAGSHIGTTFTGWMVVVLGFQLDLSTLSWPLLGLGGLGTALLAASSRSGSSARLVLGFGLLLFGLGYMKAAVEGVADLVPLQALASQPVPLFALAGLMLATLLQSSTATMMISLSFLNAGALTLPMAAAITCGAHIGSTSTMVLGVLRGDASSRRVTAFNVTYSSLTALLALFLVVPFLTDLQAWLGVRDPLYMLVGFHTGFTLCGAVLFYPLIVRAAPLLERHVGTRRDQVSQYISKVPAQISEAGETALARESLHVLGRALDLVARPFGGQAGQSLRPPPPPRSRLASRPGYLDDYATLKILEGEILSFAAQLHAASQRETHIAEDNRRLAAVREAVYAVKSIKDVRSNLNDLRLRASTHAWTAQLGAHVLATVSSLDTLLSAPEPPSSDGYGAVAQSLSALLAQHEQWCRDAMAACVHWPGILRSTGLNVVRELDLALRGLIRATKLILLHDPREKAEAA